jgi:hypothetical protein
MKTKRKSRSTPRKAVHGDIFLVPVYDSKQAHKIFADAKLLDRYYDALEANRVNDGPYSDGDTARNADRARGEFFVAVLAWARDKGAALPCSALQNEVAK